MKADPYGAIRNGEGKGIHKVELPLGAVVIRLKKGKPARFVKIRMGGNPGTKWIQYAKWWWEKNKGPVPAGKLVIHADGDQMNDAPSNLRLATPGQKLVIAHGKSKQWSKWQHRRAAMGIARLNRERGRTRRSRGFLKNCWYPVVDSLGVIFNLPFKKRKRLLAAFGADVSGYPRCGIGVKPTSVVQRTIRAARVTPVHSREFSIRRYDSFCLMNPLTKEYVGPLGGTVSQLTAQLERMGLWSIAEAVAKKDLLSRK